MLDAIRKKSSGKLASLLLILLAVGMGLWGLESVFHSARSQQEVARIGDTEITKQDLLIAIRRAQIFHTPKAWQEIQSNQALRRQLKQQILSKLIYRAGSVNGLVRYQYYFDNTLLKQAVAELPFFQVDGEFSFKRYQLALSRLGYNEAALLEEVKLDILSMYMQQVLVRTNFILPNESNTLLLAAHGLRDIGLFKVNVDQQLPKIKVTDKQVKQFYLSHKDLFQTDASYDVDYIEVPHKKLQSRIKISDSTLRSYYQTNRNEFTRRPAMFKANWLVIKRVDEALRTPDNKQEQFLSSFSLTAKDKRTLTKLLSDGTWHFYSTQNNQWSSVLKHLPYSNYFNLLKPRRTAYLLPMSSGNYLVVKLKAMRAKTFWPYKTVRKKLKQKLLQQRLKAYLPEAFEHFSEVVYTHPEDLKVPAKLYGVPVKSIKALKLNALPKTGLFARKQVREALLKKQVRVGHSSDVIELPDRWVVIRPVAFKPAGAQPLKLAWPKAKQALLKSLALKRSMNIARTLTRALSTHHSVNDLEKKYHLKWHVFTGIGQQTSQTHNALFTSHFIERIFEHNAPGVAEMYQYQPGKWFVFKVLKQYRSKPDAITAKRDAFTKGVFIDLWSDLEFSLLREGLLAGQKIDLFIKPNQLDAVS